MSILTETQQMIAEGSRVAMARLVKLEFLSTTKYLWEGHGYLTAGGKEWLGFGELGSMTGLEQAVQGTAPMATFSLSGVDSDFIAYAANSEVEVKDRPITVFLQFLSERMTPLDAPIAVYVGAMDVMTFAANGPRERTISVTAETLFADRVRSPYSYITDADQRGRYPTDRGLEFVAVLRNKTVNWLRS